MKFWKIQEHFKMLAHWHHQSEFLSIFCRFSNIFIQMLLRGCGEKFSMVKWVNHSCWNLTLTLQRFCTIHARTRADLCSWDSLILKWKIIHHISLLLQYLINICLINKILDEILYHCLETRITKCLGMLRKYLWEFWKLRFKIFQNSDYIRTFDWIFESEITFHDSNNIYQWA